MPKKTKKGKKPENDFLTLEPRAAKEPLKVEIQCLLEKLDERSKTSIEEIRAQQELHHRVTELRKDLKEECETTEDIKSSITHKFKSMEQDMHDKMKALEFDITDLNSQIAAVHKRYDTIKAEKLAQIKQLDSKIVQLNQELKELGAQIEHELTETVVSIKRCIGEPRQWAKATTEEIQKQIRERVEMFSYGSKTVESKE